MGHRWVGGRQNEEEDPGKEVFRGLGEVLPLGWWYQVFFVCLLVCFLPGVCFIAVVYTLHVCYK